MIPALYATRLALVLAALVLAGTPVSAQGTAQERSACEGDAFKFCFSDIPDVSKIEACMKQHMSELTPACRAEFQPKGKSKLRAEHFR